MTISRTEMLATIRDNIARHGHHIYIIAGGPAPRFSYTIGLRETVGSELVLAGAVFYMSSEVTRIVNHLASQLRAGQALDSGFRVDGLGSFSLRRMHPSWESEMVLGALDYYDATEASAYQIVPDDEHWTVDVPDLARERSVTAEPVWKWISEPWSAPVPRDSRATTNLAALRGGRITEAARWENDQWELFCGPGPDVTEKDMRVVPLGTLLAVDDSLSAVLTLENGEALWREPDVGDWNPWTK